MLWSPSGLGFPFKIRKKGSYWNHKKQGFFLVFFVENKMNIDVEYQKVVNVGNGFHLSL